MPFSVLRVSGAKVRPAGEESQLQRLAKLPRANFPVQVFAAQLRPLYAAYNVTPDWEQAAQAAQTAAQPGTRTANIQATVQEIDLQRNTLALHMGSGKTIALQVSKALLPSLQQEDRGEVTLRQTSTEQQSGKGRPVPSSGSQEQ